MNKNILRSVGSFISIRQNERIETKYVRLVDLYFSSGPMQQRRRYKRMKKKNKKIEYIYFCSKVLTWRRFLFRIFNVTLFFYILCSKFSSFLSLSENADKTKWKQNTRQHFISSVYFYFSPVYVPIFDPITDIFVDQMKWIIKKNIYIQKVYLFCFLFTNKFHWVKLSCTRKWCAKIIKKEKKMMKWQYAKITESTCSHS